MLGTRRFPKSPIVEYRVTRRERQNYVAFSEVFTRENAHILATKFKDLCKELNLPDDELMTDSEEVFLSAWEFVPPSLRSLLMNSELGQGVLLGYIWSSLVWSLGEELDDE